jgi:hypothetical protein
MRSAAVVSALVGATAAQGITQPISPQGAPPAGCKPSWDGKFHLTVVQASKKRDLSARAECGGSDTLVSTLSGGVLKDAQGRTGYIASNYQFQYDGPPQAGAIYTAGFSVCADGSIALGPSTTFYQCRSGDFSNLYDRNWAPQCSPINLIAVPCGGNAGQVPDGQVTVGTKTVQTTVITQIQDGQPQVITTVVPVPIKQIPDGQVQGPTSAPVKQIPDGQVQGPSSIPVKQIPDGQVQAPTTVPAPPATTVKQIPDGQVQAPTSAPVKQIPDGQVQVPPTTVKQISDGQIQVPTTSVKPPPAANTTRVTVPANVAGQTSVSPVIAFVLAAAGALFML